MINNSFSIMISETSVMLDAESSSAVFFKNTTIDHIIQKILYSFKNISF